MLSGSKTHEMVMGTLKCHAKGILVNKVTRKRLGEKSPEPTLEETSIKTRLDWKQFTLQGMGLQAERGGVCRGGSDFTSY